MAAIGRGDSLPDMTGPRIAIVGSAGTGKTTLAEAAAARLKLPLIADAMRRRLTEGLDLHAMSRADHRGLLERQAAGWAVEASRPGEFVSDGSALDFAAFWLANGYAVDDPDGFGRLLDAARAAIARLDHVFLLPWGAIPLVGDGVRYANPWHQLHAQSVIEGLLDQFVPAGRLHRIDATDAVERLAAVSRRCGI